jgi:hypothetical protein
MLSSDDGNDTFLRNVGLYKCHTASHPIIPAVLFSVRRTYKEALYPGCGVDEIPASKPGRRQYTQNPLPIPRAFLGKVFLLSCA